VHQKILRLQPVKELTGLSRTRLYTLIAEGSFPRQIQLSQNGRCVGWLEHEIQDWIRQRVESSRREMRAAS
jgi:prophage regulatory protein